MDDKLRDAFVAQSQRLKESYQDREDKHDELVNAINDIKESSSISDKRNLVISIIIITLTAVCALYGILNYHFL